MKETVFYGEGSTVVKQEAHSHGIPLPVPVVDRELSNKVWIPDH